MKILLLAACILIVFVSCSRSHVSNDSESDLLKPSMKIEYPLDVPELPRGYPLCMKILIKDNRDLSTVWLEVNDGTGFRKEYTPVTRSIEIIEKYFPPVGVSGAYKAKFFAMDHAGNTSSAEIKFVINN